MSEEYKLVVLVRTDLDMGKGKTAAQVAHAAVQCAFASKRRDPKSFDAWFSEGQKTVALKVGTKEEMLRYMAEASSKGITCALICDSGRTEVEPGTATCVGIGPEKESVVDGVTGSLKML